MTLSSTRGNIQHIVNPYTTATSPKRVILTDLGHVGLGGNNRLNIIIYVICAIAKKPICGISSFFHPITSPRKEKKSAAVNAQYL